MKKRITDNKTFWKTIKPFLLDKITSTQKITLIEKEDIMMGDDNTAKVLNIFFINIVSNLKIEGYSNSRKVYSKNRRLTSFSKIQRDEILSDMETSKVCQDTNFLQKLSKRMWIYLLTSLFQIFTILLKNPIFHP